MTSPVDYAHVQGFTKLGDLHNQWMVDMIDGEGDRTLQAHRGSYKTTCVAVALTLIIILHPEIKTMFNRKTDNDVKEIIKQVSKMLKNEQTRALVTLLYGEDSKLQIVKETETEISTNLCQYDPRGGSQLIGIGTKGSITGKHYDRIFTDDIVNKEDRMSGAEREKTKAFYQELQNVKNRDGRIYNTGTPWHKDDCFTIMPEPQKYDYTRTGLISDDDIQFLKEHMTASLFAANYELKHIASEDVLFMDPQTGGDPEMIKNGESHIDAAYGGKDSCAFTILRKANGKYYVLGKKRKMHIDRCLDEFVQLHKLHRCKMLSNENNGDKGFLAKVIRKKGVLVHSYYEDQNKFAKIASYIKYVWKDVVFVEGTDSEYIEEICDFNIDAAHDDCPDSLATLIRKMWDKSEPRPDELYLQFL